MGIWKLPVVLAELFVALNHLEGTPIERQEWIVPVLRNMLLKLRGAKPKHEANPKVVKWKSRDATPPLVQLNAWKIF
uniref:Uncharacterized protein n=1 Tax=Balaenoptera musculus TaxID=9771 RepID=A0A8C0CVE8_BALMU